MCTRLLLVAALMTSLVLLQAAAARRKGGTHKHHPPPKPTPAPEPNVCDVNEPEANVYCYCRLPDLGIASEATCWVFSPPVDDDGFWDAFLTQPRIESVRLNVRPDGRLTRMPTALLRVLPRLRTLDLQYASVSHVPALAFCNSSTLHSLQLSRNQVVHLAPRAFAHLPHLQLLSLGENRIQELPTDVFVDLPRLRTLLLDRNNLSVLHERAFQNLVALEELDLHGNQLPAVTRLTFAGLSHLHRLDLRDNHLGALADGTFVLLTGLRELELGENDIQFVSNRAFAGLGHLRRLAIQDNRISTLPSPEIFLHIHRVRLLDLRDNDLTTLTVDVVAPVLNSMRNASAYLYLEGNSLQCDCRLSWMYVLRNETDSEQVRNTLEELTCFLEGNVGLPISDEDDRDEEDLEEVRELELDDDPSVNFTPPVRQQVRHLLEIPLNKLPCHQRLVHSTKLSDMFQISGYGYGYGYGFDHSHDNNSKVRTNAAGSHFLTKASLIFAVVVALVSE